MPRLKTERLLLRPWQESDLPVFAAMNADPLVMRHFPACLSREQSDAAAHSIMNHFAEFGYGFWAVEIPQIASFIGFIGLKAPQFEAHFTPCVEIGWRLARTYWKQGFATEGAEAAMRFSFSQLQLEELVSFTVVNNLPSRRVMEKLGMTHNPADDFDHPNLPVGHSLRRHVLYRRRRFGGIDSDHE